MLRKFYLKGSLTKRLDIAITNKILKTADPTMLPILVPLPACIPPSPRNKPMVAVSSSGNDPPKAIKVAPATSDLISN